MEALQASALPLGHATKTFKGKIIKFINLASCFQSFLFDILVFLGITMSRRALSSLFHDLGACPTQETRALSYNKFCVDSREVQPGDVFVAIPGARVDGHSFVLEAEKRGASLVLVEKAVSGIKIPAIVVPNTIDCLQNLAKRAVEASKAKVIGITGSLGKTTTKEFVKTILSASLKTAATKANQNSQVGLALSLLNELEGEEEALVLEMGMTCPGHIKKLVSFAPPHIALITSVNLVHAEFFENLEGIARAKAEIFSHERTKIGIYHHLIAHQEVIANAGHCKKRTYCQGESQADSQNAFITSVLENGKICFKEEGQEVLTLQMNFPASHVYDLCLAACTVARMCGMSWEHIAHRIPHLRLPPKRLEVVQTPYATFINDSYNASEDSTLAALVMLKSLSSDGAKVAVLGSMKELGVFSEGCHRGVGKKAASVCDLVCCFGQECWPLVEEVQKAKKPAFLFEDFDTLIAFLQRALASKDLVLLKGARSMGMWRVLDHFSRR
jgi:UDP-N-acetylmuramoyl-tripeptide--D-alanyl-D-alanine ligase